jgi:hypothetical protein
MLKYLLFFFLGILTFVILCFTSWWLLTALVIWTVILFRLVQSAAKLKEKTDHPRQHTQGMPIQELES